jgi:hypothetical protein
MKLRDVPTSILEGIIRDTERVSGGNSRALPGFRRELQRRMRQTARGGARKAVRDAQTLAKILAAAGDDDVFALIKAAKQKDKNVDTTT